MTATIPRLATDATTDEVIAHLRDGGACIVENRLTADAAEALRHSIEPLLTTAERGHDGFLGFETCRLGAMLAFSEQIREMAVDPLVVGSAREFLSEWCHTIQLMLTQVIAIGPGETKQLLHRDRLAWGGFIPRTIEPQVNTMWALTDFTEENGATQVVPGSNQWDDGREATPDEVRQAVMPAGSVLVYTGSVIHGGGANDTDETRLGLNMDYCLDWLRQEENQYLTCPPEVAKNFSPDLAELVGYSGGGLILGYWSDPHDTADRSAKQPETALGRAPQGSGTILTDAAIDRTVEVPAGSID